MRVRWALDKTVLNEAKVNGPAAVRLMREHSYARCPGRDWCASPPLPTASTHTLMQHCTGRMRVVAVSSLATIGPSWLLWCVSVLAFPLPFLLCSPPTDPCHRPTASCREPGWLLRAVSVCEYPEQTELRRMCSEATAPVSGEICATHTHFNLVLGFTIVHGAGVHLGWPASLGTMVLYHQRRKK